MKAHRSEIARQLEVSPSTISREIARNSTEKRKSYNPQKEIPEASRRKTMVSEANFRLSFTSRRKGLS
uniref:helix-turn-helix domain-containing protein n=1 Tax=Porphyromonas gulae TaxID=111105 RepID=UPI0009B8B949|nr:helix-turn-helix domain-containing protein [Porphyromonas gulae]